MTKEYHVCGIGNGLVDLQYEVGNEVIERLGLAKGQMRLVAPDYQAEIIRQLEGQNQYKSSGGSAANTIIAFSQFGGKAAYKTSLGNDLYGHFYADEFQSLGIKLSSRFRNDLPTGTCLVLITPDSERTMLTALGASAEFNKSNLDEDLIKASEWIYIEGYEFTQDASAEAVDEAIEMAKQHKVKIALTVSDMFIIELFGEKLKSAVVNSDLVFLNKNEAKAFTGKDTSDEAFDALSKYCPNYVVTFGAKGSRIKWEGRIIDIPPYPANPVDTTGAGDMYAGAFLYGTVVRSDPQKAGTLASFASARIVSQFGARLRDYIEEMKNEIFT